MSDDHLRPGVHDHRQAAALARSIADDVYPFSRRYRPLLDRAGLGRNGVRAPADLRRLPVTTYGALGQGRDAVLRPSADAIRREGDRDLRLRLWVAGLMGSRDQVLHDKVEPRYKPLVWLRQGALDVGSTADDLDVLADLGRRTLERAGVRGGDRVVNLVSPSDLAFWQVSLGCRDGGVASTHLGAGASAESVVAADPTVVVGSSATLLALRRSIGAPLPSVRTVVATGSPLGDADRRALAALGADAAVVAVWAPPGVRALWSECREGHALHTWPDHEVIEVLSPVGSRAATEGELVWSAVGWRGTVVLRLRTGAFGRLVTGTCRACGRTTPRLEISSLEPPFAIHLDDHPKVALWCAEVSNGRDGDGLRVQIAPIERRGATRLAEELADELGAAVEVVSRRQIEAFVAERRGERIDDLR